MLLIYFFLINQNLTDSISLKGSNIDLENVKFVSLSVENTIIYSVGNANILFVNFRKKITSPISQNNDIKHIARGLSSDYFILWDLDNKISHFDKYHQLKDEYSISDEPKGFRSFVYTDLNNFLILDEDASKLITYSLFERKIIHQEDLNTRSAVKLENALFRKFERNYVLIGENNSIMLSPSGFYIGEMPNIGSDFYKNNSIIISRNEKKLHLNQNKLSSSVISFDVVNRHVFYLTDSLTLIRNKCD